MRLEYLRSSSNKSTGVINRQTLLVTSQDKPMDMKIRKSQLASSLALHELMLKNLTYILRQCVQHDGNGGEHRAAATSATMIGRRNMSKPPLHFKDREEEKNKALFCSTTINRTVPQNDTHLLLHCDSKAKGQNLLTSTATGMPPGGFFCETLRQP